MENENHIIYGLFDPRDWELRYIGQTIRPKKRYEEHLKDKARSHKVYWIQSLLNLGLKPEMIEFHKTNLENCEKDEMFWIKKLRDKGYNLTNGTDGGDRGPRMFGNKFRLGKKHTKETLEKISKASIGNKYALGYHNTEESRKKRSLSHIGLIRSEEHKKNIGIGRKGIKNSKESIEKMRISILNSYKNGRKPSVTIGEYKVRLVDKLLKDEIPPMYIMKALNVSETSLYRVKHRKGTYIRRILGNV